MYSPKIDEELIPRLYRLRKLRRIPMTRLVNGILENALLELEKEEGEKGNPLADLGATSVRRLDDLVIPSHDDDRICRTTARHLQKRTSRRPTQRIALSTRSR